MPGEKPGSTGVVTDIDSQKKAEVDKLYEIYGRTITAMFNEVVDMDYAGDRLTLLHSKERPQMVGRTARGISRAARNRAEQLHLSGSALQAFVDFVECRQTEKEQEEGALVSGNLPPTTGSGTGACGFP